MDSDEIVYQYKMTFSNIADIHNKFLMELLVHRMSGVGPLDICNEHIIARDTYSRSCLHVALSKTRDYDGFEDSLKNIGFAKPPKILGWPSLNGLENFRKGSQSDGLCRFRAEDYDIKDSGTIPVDLDLVKQLIHAGADVNAVDSGGNSCLHYAAENEECCDIIPLLLNAGAKLDSLNNHGDSPLLTAVKVDNLKAVEALIEFGADINVSNNHGDSALHLAGDDTILCSLLNAGCTVPMNHVNECGCTPFLAAVEYCKVETLHRMIQAGADPKFVHRKCGYYDCPRKLRTPLRIAVVKNRDAIVEVLLKYGANPNENFARNFDKNVSTLYLAASFNFSGSDNRTPAASEDEKSANILQLLITYGADICNDMQAFLSVIEEKNLRAVRICLNEFYRRGLRVPTDDPLLQLSVWNKRDDVFKFVLESNFNDIDKKDTGGYTALHRAIQLMKYERVEKLLGYGADVNTMSNEGKTVLESALDLLHLPVYDYRDSHDDFLILLLQHGSLSDWRTNLTNLDVGYFQQLPESLDFQQKIKIIVMHLALIESIGYPIPRDILSCILMEYPKSIGKLYASCKTEIALSQSLLIKESVPVYDILTNIDHRYARNESQVEKFIDKDVHEQFPVYESLIRHRFALSKEKLERVSKALKGLRRILQMDYETFYHIYENIFSKLRPIDLLVLEQI